MWRCDLGWDNSRTLPVFSTRHFSCYNSRQKPRKNLTKKRNRVSSYLLPASVEQKIQKSTSPTLLRQEIDLFLCVLLISNLFWSAEKHHVVNLVEAEWSEEIKFMFNNGYITKLILVLRSYKLIYIIPCYLDSILKNYAHYA